MTQHESRSVIRNDTPLWRGARHLVLWRGCDFVYRCEAARASVGVEEIHDFRVASRRLREVLTLVAPCYPPKVLGKLRRQVRDVTRLLGTLRNIDEAHLFFTALEAELDSPHRVALAPYLMAHTAARSVHLAEVMSGIQQLQPERFVVRYRDTLALPALVGGSSEVDPFMPLRDFAQSAMDEGHGVLLALVSPARVPEDDAARHRLRIALKHYRYRFELFEPLADGEYGAVYRLIKEYQGLLGTLNDLTVFEGMVDAGLVPEPYRAGITALIRQKKGDQVRCFLELTGKSPLAMIRFPFGG